MIQKNMKKKAEKKDAPAKAARARHAAPQSASVRRAPAYRINRRFPESSSTSRQLQLLEEEEVWGAGVQFRGHPK